VSTGMEANAAGRHPLEVDLVAYADGDLSPKDAAEVQAHVSSCDVCLSVLGSLAAPIAGVVVEHPGPIDSGIVDLFASEPTADPAVGDLWRLEWEDQATLAVVTGINGPIVSILPAAVDSPDDDIDPAVEADESPLGIPLFLWHDLSYDVPLGVFSQRAGAVPPAAIEEAGPPRERSWAIAAAMAEALAAVNRLAAAEWVPKRPATAPVDLAATLKQQGLIPSRIEALTGIPAARLLAFVRGSQAPTWDEALRLGELLDVDPGSLHRPVSLPDALIWAIERPVHRMKLRLRAIKDGLTEAGARFQVAEEVLARAARTTPGQREVDAWDELVRHHLDA